MTPYQSRMFLCARVYMSRDARSPLISLPFCTGGAHGLDIICALNCTTYIYTYRILID